MIKIKAKCSIWADKVKFGLCHPIRLVKKVMKKRKDKKLFVSKDLYKSNKKNRPKKTLIYFNHYFNPKSDFPGKSTKQERKIRKEIVQRSLDSLKSIENADVYVCGIKSHSLLPIDIDFSDLENPAHIVYESIEKMFDHIDDYAYFINIEDDILLEPITLQNIIDFDRGHSNIRDCWHPNRLEEAGGKVYCPDFISKPGWVGKVKKYRNKNLRIGFNPHSGLMILSQEKMKFAQEKVDLKTRRIIIGYYMASAYANINEPFNLYRSRDLENHAVYHLDQWEER